MRGGQMNRLIRNLTSLANLTKIARPTGQIATLLVLLMIIVLIFVLVTVNIGNVSVNATKIANAADAAALMLASNLATKSTMMWEGLGYTYEKCQKRSWWSIILSVVIAIIAIVIAIITYGFGLVAVIGEFTVAGVVVTEAMVLGAIFIAAGAIGGMIGGMSGAAIDGTSIAQGALTGFTIGVALGTIAAGIGGLTVETIIPGVSVMVTESTPAFIVLGALSVAATLYTDVQKNMAIGDVLKQIEKDMAKLNERDRFKETAVYTALSRVVDDPNKVPDAQDMNGNGNYSELVPAFYAWWHLRMLQYANAASVQAGYAQAFVNAIQNFTSYLNSASGILDRLDYKWIPREDGDWAVTGTDDGPIVALLRGLDSVPAYRTTHWKLGPSPDAMNAWLDEDCCSGDEPTCPYPRCSADPAGFDDIDKLGDNLRGMAIVLNGMLGQEGLAATWPQWIYYFYNYQNSGEDAPPDSDSYYDYLNRQITMLQDLRSQIIDIRDNRLPDCHVGCRDVTTGVCAPCSTGAGHWEVWWFSTVWVPDGDCLMSPPTPAYPCRLSTGGGTINDDLVDDFQPALNAIDSLMGEMSNFAAAIRNFIDQINSAYGNLGTLSGSCGENCVMYTWEDARGIEQVRVDVGPFLMPRYDTKKSWSKTCIRLIWFWDMDRCWVRVTRWDPRPTVGILGRWNPFNRGVTKIGKAYYGWQPGTWYPNHTAIGIKATSR